MEHTLLSGLSEEDRRSVLSRMGRRSFRKDDTLFYEGDPGDSLHLVEKGRVAIRVSTRNGDAAIVAVVGRGESFGEQALIDPSSRRTATVVALEPVETRTMHRKDFAALREAEPSFDRLLVALLATQVRRLTEQLLDALYVPVDVRIARRISDLATVYADDGAIVDIPLRQDDLASLAGTTRPTTNRVLQQLADDGLVALRRGGLHVLDVGALARRAR